MVDFKNGAVIKRSKTKNFVHEDVCSSFIYK